MPPNWHDNSWTGFAIRASFQQINCSSCQDPEMTTSFSVGSMLMEISSVPYLSFSSDLLIQVAFG